MQDSPNSAGVVIDALRAVDRGGTVVVNAIHLDGIPAFDYGLLWHERTLTSVANVTPTDVREFLVEADRLDIRVDHRTRPLEAANEAGGHDNITAALVRIG